MSETMTLRGFGWDKANNRLDKKCSSLPCEQPYSTPGGGNKTHHGMPITAEAAYNIVWLFYKKVTMGEPTTSPLKDILWVEFSKASLFRIMAQETCDYVRFYFGVPDE